MCGIAGIAWSHTATPCDPSILQRMAASLAHRGPDGSHIVRLDQADFIHTRLAIIDPQGGDQPLRSDSATLIANGEIYNDPDIRKKFASSLYKTGSDCESALRLWEQEGTAFTAGLRGMYAIAIHDTRSRELTLSRDPFGIKPLYIASFPGGIIFASEAQTILASGLVQPAINSERRDELLQLGFTTGRPTIYPGIRRILPGETIRITNGQISWSGKQRALPAGNAEEISEEDAIKRLDAALTDSIRVHERADVPFGMFLSGGIDSAAVLATMKRFRDHSGDAAPLLAWTATFDVPGAADESAAAAEMAKAAGAQHHILKIHKDDVWRNLPSIVAAMDDPVADYAIIPTWLLAREASKEVRVVLSGEGGDELFAGYGRYRTALRPWWRGGRRPWRRGIFDGTSILRSTICRNARWRDGITTAAMNVADAPTRLATFQAPDIAEWLPNDLLTKLDRCLMAHGIEGRTPLLDPAIANASWRLPDRLRLHGKTGKWLLRTWLAQHFPAAQPFAPKQGFTVPIGNWIESDSRQIGQLVASDPCIQEIAFPERVRALFLNASGRRERHAAWTLLFYVLWHRIHIRGIPADGDLLSTLAA